MDDRAAPPRLVPPPGCPIVLKIGSSSLTHRGGGIDERAVARAIRQVGIFWDAGHPTVLVSSGAVAAGSPTLGGRPTDMTGLQVAAAVGQTMLIAEYSRAFASAGRTAGQVLVTLDVLSVRSRYLHARGALTLMLDRAIVPVVNENDTVAVDGLKMGDNDRLAAIVSHLVGAGMLIILTDTDGLYSEDPRLGGGEPIGMVGHRDPILDKVAAGSAGPMGSGGVGTKVEASRMAAWSGIPTVIARADRPRVVENVIEGRPVGTYVRPGDAKLPARKLWLAFGQPPEGCLVIDEGAVRALVRRGGSLLPVGVTGVEGEFAAGAAVEVRDGSGRVIGKGLASAASPDIKRWMGKRSTEIGRNGEVIHRDNLVVLAD